MPLSRARVAGQACRAQHLVGPADLQKSGHSELVGILWLYARGLVNTSVGTNSTT